MSAKQLMPGQAQMWQENLFHLCDRYDKPRPLGDDVIANHSDVEVTAACLAKWAEWETTVPALTAANKELRAMLTELEWEEIDDSGEYRCVRCQIKC